MADHDGHTINVGPVTVGIDTDAIREFYNVDDGPEGDRLLCDEVDRLRAANEHLADALADIAEGECSRMDDRRCHDVYPAEPYEWCPTCVAVVGWSAWSMGVTR